MADGLGGGSDEAEGTGGTNFTLGCCASAGLCGERDTEALGDCGCAVLKASVETVLSACKMERPAVEPASFAAQGLATEATTRFVPCSTPGCGAGDGFWVSPAAAEDPAEPAFTFWAATTAFLAPLSAIRRAVGLAISTLITFLPAGGVGTHQ